MVRYFTENKEEDHDQVFVISKDTIDGVRRREKYLSERYGSKKNNPRIYRSDKRKKPSKSKPDKFPGKVPIKPEALEKHSRGSNGVVFRRVKTKFAKKEQKKREKSLRLVNEIAARTEFLLDEEPGCLEGDKAVYTTQITQTQIRNAVDQESATKGFDLNLPLFGPYKIDYTRNGRYLVLGGRKGHVAAFDWQSKNLMCEINVMESVHDVQWLHTEQMFAVAQKRWTYIYDNQGIELHCLKKLDNIVKLQFLPHHFLLVSGSDKGFLSWVDVSKGTLVAQFNTRMGRLDVMTQNPANAVICCGHAKGIVTMWTPNVQEPVAKILTNRQPIRSIAVDDSGTYLATAAVDRSLKIWDVRNTYACLQSYRISSGASQLSFSGRGLLGVAIGNVVEIYKDSCTRTVDHPYMRHKVFRTVTDIRFTPFEDVLGIGHAAGFSSILVPGSGEANFDALESNPFQTKKQRRETEVKGLLEKIQPELITLDPTRLGDVDVPTLDEKRQERESKLFVKPLNIDFEPRDKAKGGTAKKFKIKRAVIEEERRKTIKKIVKDTGVIREGKTKTEKKPKGVLDRLK